MKSWENIISKNVLESAVKKAVSQSKQMNECKRRHKEHRFIFTGKIEKIYEDLFEVWKCKWCPLHQHRIIKNNQTTGGGEKNE